MSKFDEFFEELSKNDYVYNILVPILDDFDLVPCERGVLFSAISKDKYLEQYICDGILEDGETLESHIYEVISNAKSAMHDNGFINVDNSFEFYKDYKNKHFSFKVYLQDLIKDGKILRQYNVYFVDSITNAFFQVSLTTCPYSTHDKDIVEGEITSNMDKTMTDLMNKIRYRK